MPALVPLEVCHAGAPVPPIAVRRGTARPLWPIVAAIFSGFAVASPSRKAITGIARASCRRRPRRARRRRRLRNLLVLPA